MQVIKSWPDDVDLSIEDEIKQALIRMLVEPFDSDQMAKEFWSTYGNTLVIIATEDTREELENRPEQLQQQLNFALSYPEFVEKLPLGYQLSLTIFSDEGTGCYILYAPNSPLIPFVGEGYL